LGVEDAYTVHWVVLYGILVHAESLLPLKSLLVQPLLPLVRRMSPFISSIQGQFGFKTATTARTERAWAYIRGLASIYQPDNLVDAATAAISLIESDLIDYIEVDTSI
jgi:hypothetical protein